jgi:hypothetical protein
MGAADRGDLVGFHPVTGDPQVEAAAEAVFRGYLVVGLGAQGDGAPSGMNKRLRMLSGS